MTHPLITFMKTPMAAPETAALRRMRKLWMALCWLLALAVLLLPILKALVGTWAALPALLLAAEQLAATTLREYTVVKGDTLSAIGKRFGVKWRDIAELNDIKNPDLIFPGQVFKIPNA